jgi:Uma2 family endonuclease
MKVLRFFEKKRYFYAKIYNMGSINIDVNKKYTYADYLKWTFEETVELIRGHIFPMPAPLSNHQDSTGNLFNIFKTYLKGQTCKVYTAPFDVRLPKPLSQRLSDQDIETVVQPDISVICDLKKIDRRGCLGAPDLIVEVLSRSTASKDIKDKFDVYEEAGVREYWTVGVEDRTVNVFRLDSKGKYCPDQRPYVAGDAIRVGIFSDFHVAVDDIFEGLLEFNN